MQKARNDAIEAQQNRTVALSSSMISQVRSKLLIIIPGTADFNGLINKANAMFHESFIFKRDQYFDEISLRGKQTELDIIVVVLSFHDTFQKVLQMVETLVATNPKRILLISNSTVRCWPGAFIKSVQHEYPRVLVRAIEVEFTTTSPSIDSNILDCINKEIASLSESEVFYDQRWVRYVRRYGKIDIASGSLFSRATASGHGAYIITGGLGYLGLSTAKVLIQLGRKNIVLVSRSNKVADGKGLDKNLTWLINNSGASVQTIKCDVSDEKSIISLLNSVRETHMLSGGIRGIIHCAGVLKDGLIRGGKASSGVDDVWLSKAHSAFLLDQHTKTDQLECFMCFSSIAAAVGNTGQSVYSAANGYLDSLMIQRVKNNNPGLSVQWPAISGAGMAKNVSLESLDLSQFEATLTKLLSFNINSAVVTIVPPSMLKIMSRLPKQISLQFLDLNNEANEFVAPILSGSKIIQIRKQPSKDLHQIVANVVTSLIPGSAIGSLDYSRNLMDLGLDSFGAVELNNLLSKETGADLPPGLVFSYPTVNDIVEYLKEVIKVPDNKVPNTEEAKTMKRQNHTYSSTFSMVSSTAAEFVGGTNAGDLDPSRNLMDLGLDSFGASELVNRLSAEVGFNLPPSLVFSYPTINDIVEYLTSEVLQDGAEEHKDQTRISLTPILPADFSEPRESAPTVQVNKFQNNPTQSHEHIETSMLKLSEDEDVRDLFLVATFFLYAIIIFPAYCCLALTRFAVSNLSIVYALMSIPISYFMYVLSIIIVTVILKWVIIGRYKEGRWSTKSVYYLRWWFVDKLITQATSIIRMYPYYCIYGIWFRLMGARISSTSKLYTSDLREFDLLCIGDLTVIDYGVSISAAVFEKGYLIVQRVEIGNNCTVLTGCKIGAGSVIVNDCKILSGSHVNGRTLIAKSGVYEGSELAFVSNSIGSNADIIRIGFTPVVDFILSFCSIVIFGAIMTLLGVLEHFLFTLLFGDSVSTAGFLNQATVAIAIINTFGWHFSVAIFWFVHGIELIAALDAVQNNFLLLVAAIAVIKFMSGFAGIVVSSVFNGIGLVLDRLLLPERSFLYLAYVSMKSSVVYNIYPRFAKLWSGTPGMVLYVRLHGGIVGIRSLISLSNVATDLSRLRVSGTSLVMDPNLPSVLSSFFAQSWDDEYDVETGSQLSSRGAYISIGEGAYIGPYSTLDENSTVGLGSVLLPLSKLRVAEELPDNTSRLGVSNLTVASNFESPPPKTSILVVMLVELLACCFPLFLLFVQYLCYIPGVLLQQYLLSRNSDTGVNFFYIIVCWFLSAITLLVLVSGINKLRLLFFPTDRNSSILSPSFLFRQFCLSLEYITNELIVDLLVGSSLYNIWLRSMGATVSLDSIVLSTALSDKENISITDKVSVNRGVVLSPLIVFTSEGEAGFICEEINIRSASTIGSYSFIYGSVTIEEQSVIGCGTVLFVDSVVSGQKIVVGMPPREFTASRLKGDSFSCTLTVHSPPVHNEVSEDLEVERIQHSSLSANRNVRDSADCTILFTGGAGYFGRNCLFALLTKNLSVRIVCIIRGTSKEVIEAKLLKALEQAYGRKVPHSDWSRIDIVQGDVSKRNFGIPQSQYDNLSMIVTHVFHFAASISHGLRYANIRASNVVATQEVIYFALNKQRKTVIYCSTYAMCTVSMTDHSGYIADNCKLAKQEFIYTGTAKGRVGYIQSKWVSEKLLCDANRLYGMPTSIFRVGWIGANSNDGEYADDYIISYLKACIQLQMVPRSAFSPCLSQVDILSSGLIELAFQKKLSLETIALLNPDMALKWQIILSTLRKAGYIMRDVSFPRFRHEVLSKISPTEAVWHLIGNQFRQMSPDTMLTCDVASPILRRLTKPTKFCNTESLLVAMIRVGIKKGDIPPPPKRRKLAAIDIRNDDARNFEDSDSPFMDKESIPESPRVDYSGFMNEDENVVEYKDNIIHHTTNLHDKA